MPFNKTSQVAISIKIDDLLICFCSFDFSLLEGDSFVKDMYIVLSCFIKWCSF